MNKLIKTALIALSLLFVFSVAWFIAVPLFDTIASSFLDLAIKHSWTSSTTVIGNVITLVSNALIWIGILGALAIVIWMIVYSFRREVDTYEV